MMTIATRRLYIKMPQDPRRRLPRVLKRYMYMHALIVYMHAYMHTYTQKYIHADRQAFS